MQSLLQEGLPRLLAGLFGGIVLCMAAIWLVSRLRTMLAVASLVSAFALFMLVAGGAGYLPTLAHALWRLFRDYSTDLDLMVVIGSWYAAMLLIGALIGSCLAVVRARRELYA